MIDPEQYQQIDQVFQAVLQLAPADRPAYLERACGADERLRKEVEALLSADEREWDLIDRPALEAGAALLTEDHPEATEGQKLGRFTILSLLGSGGMGQVYLARDARLERNVAVKLLPARFTRDRGRLRRFQQEARAASSLNHPNILTIYDLGQADDQHFIAAEYIDGMTLRQRLKDGPLSVQETLEIALQVASALEAAHRAGIVHRDIKPENVMLRADGLVKVLDFGLAKLNEPQPALDELDGEATSRTHTAVGTLMGTLPYMSPEQVKGLELDERSDLFSLGVLLYEMLAGQTPFRGEDDHELMASIVEAKLPPWPRHFPPRPSGLRPLLARALDRDREQRYQSAGDLLTDLRRLLAEQTSAAGDRPSRSRLYGGIRSWALLAAALALVAGATFIGRRLADRPDFPFQKISITPLPNTAHPVAVALSHDGKYVAQALWREGEVGIWVKDLETGSDVEVVPAGRPGNNGLTFSPDDRHLYYLQPGEEDSGYAVYRVSVPDGSGVTKILGGAASMIAFSSDGSRFAFVRQVNREESALMVVHADGSGERTLAVRKNPDYFDTEKPAWSPDGRLIACAVGTRAAPRHRVIAEVRVEDGGLRPITDRRWQNLGEMEWLSDGNGLLVIGVEKEEGSEGNPKVWHLSYPGGELRKITGDLDQYFTLGLTRDSRTFITIRDDWRRDFWVAPGGDSSQARPITTGRRDNYRFISWTPDGKLVYPSSASGRRDIWTMEADGTGYRQITRNAGSNLHVSASPDGRYLVCSSNRGASENYNVWRLNRDGGGALQLTRGETEGQPKCSPDGRWVVYTSATPDGDLNDRRLWKVPIDGGEPARLTDRPSNWPAISPDGRWVACWYRPQPPSPWKLAVLPFAGGQPVHLFDVPTTPASGAVVGRTIRWTPDGRALTYLVQSDDVTNVWVQELGGGAPTQVTAFTFNSIDCFDWSPDGRLVCSRAQRIRDVVLIRRLD